VNDAIRSSKFDLDALYKDLTRQCAVTEENRAIKVVASFDQGLSPVPMLHYILSTCGAKLPLTNTSRFAHRPSQALHS
jgi:hypothetical protein